ncbi:ABC transporter permease [Streptosporangium lutulentum]
MKGVANVIGVELKLIVRDPMSGFFALAFPAIMLWVKTRTGKTLPGGLPVIDATVPMLSVFVIGLAGLVVLPATLAQYRERRILKRLRATPASPTMLFGAQWTAHMLLAALGTALLIVIGLAALDLSAPASAAGVLLAWTLGALSLGAIGLLIGALVPSGRTATVIGLSVFFPMVFLSGAMIPRETMSGSMRAIGDLTPMAPVVEAMRGAWKGDAISPVTLGIMVAIFIIAAAWPSRRSGGDHRPRRLPLGSRRARPAVPVRPASDGLRPATGLEAGGAGPGAARRSLALVHGHVAPCLDRAADGDDRLLRRDARRHRGAGRRRPAVHGDRGGGVHPGLHPAARVVGVRGRGGDGRRAGHRPLRPGRTPDEMLYSFLVAVLIASTAGLLTRTISDQNDQRRVMIVQLRKTGARLAALAEENAALQARLLTSAREAGVLGERQRMAREIHDTVAQSLTAILTQLEAADDAIDDAPAARSRLNTVRALARESLNETRRSVQALRPAPLDEAQLSAALHDIAEKWSQTTGVPAGVSVTGDPLPLHTEVEITLLRVAQEALANVGRHASATRVGLTLSYMEDVVILDVRDDGSGFTPGVTNSPDEGGFGLIAMRQRVTRLAGEFVIETAPGQGTGISATVPAIPADSAPDSSDRRRNAS